MTIRKVATTRLGWGLLLFSLLLASAAYSVSGPDNLFALVFTCVIPASPFLILAVIALKRSAVIHFGSIMGTVLGAATAICVPIVFIIVGWGGGANIGAGLMFFYLPIYGSIFMLIGFGIGAVIARR